MACGQHERGQLKNNKKKKKKKKKKTKKKKQTRRGHIEDKVTEETTEENC